MKTRGYGALLAFYLLPDISTVRLILEQHQGAADGLRRCIRQQ